MAVEAELKRQSSTGGLVAWTLSTDSTSPTGYADPVVEEGIRARIGNVTDAASTGAGSAIALLKRIRDVLQSSTLDVTGTITITNPTTAVTVENPTTAVRVTNPTTAVTVENPTTAVRVTNTTRAISNFPSAYPLSTAQGDDLEVVRNKNAPVTPYSQTVTTTGDTTIATPTTGNAFRLRWYHLHQDPDDGGNVVVALKLGGSTVFTDEFEPGLPFAHGTHIVGSANGSVVLNMSAARRVYVNVEVEEFTP